MYAISGYKCPLPLKSAAIGEIWCARPSLVVLAN
jgi:hypothetical protein